MEIWETKTSDKGTGVTICDLVAQLEGYDKLTERRGEFGPEGVCKETQVDMIFRLQIYMKYKCLNTKLEKLSK